MHRKIALFVALSLFSIAIPLLPQASKQVSEATYKPEAEGSAKAETSPKANAANAAPSYIIRANDVLEIYVWKETELTRKVTVRPDGRISFPLVQDMQAAGLTPGEIKVEIERELKKYIEVPNVTVIVDAIQSYRVFVSGKVGKPGAIMSEKPITVLQALSLAGGFLEFAHPAEMVVIRNTGTENLLFRFNYFDVIKGKDFNQNILLRNDDVVVVP